MTFFSVIWALWTGKEVPVHVQKNIDAVELATRSGDNDPLRDENAA
jgi:hypothetical protein